jgi:transposase
MKRYRRHVLASTYGGVAQRCLLLYSEHRRAQAQGMVDKHLLKQSEQQVKAFKKLSCTTLACEAEVQQALATLTQGL